MKKFRVRFDDQEQSNEYIRADLFIVRPNGEAEFYVRTDPNGFDFGQLVYAVNGGNWADILLIED